MSDLPVAAGLTYRESRPAGEPRGTLLCVHGFPSSSYMWRGVLEAAPAAGWRVVAPDLAGYGDAPPDPPATWDRHIEALARFHDALDLGPVALAVHDWGGLIALRWACDAPGRVRALVISGTGFFPDGKWNGMAQALRTPGQGEELAANMTEEGFRALMGSISDADEQAVTEMWKGFDGDVRRAAHLELYRSGDFERLEAYRGKLAGLGVPALILWGEDDPFAPVAGGRRLAEEIPGARLVVVEGARHFVFDDEPQVTGGLVRDFLADL